MNFNASTAPFFAEDKLVSNWKTDQAGGRNTTRRDTGSSAFALEAVLWPAWSNAQARKTKDISKQGIALPAEPEADQAQEQGDAPIAYAALSHGEGAFPSELHELDHNVERSIDNLDDLGDKMEVAEKTVALGRKALEQVVQLEKQADSFLSSVKSFRFTLKLTEKVGPLKVPSKLLDRVLERVEEAATHITFRAGQLRKKIEDGDYINKMKNAENKLDDAGKKLKELEDELKEYHLTIELAQLVFENDGGAFDGLESAFNATLATTAVNDALDALNGLYEALVGDFNDLVDSFETPGLPDVNVFDAIGEVSADFGGINNALSFLSNPLKAVQSALKPVEWALDLVGFIFDVTVGPVINWILDTLGLSDIFDRIGDKISALLPDIGILDDVTAAIDAVLAQVEDLLNRWAAEIDQLVADLRQEIIDQFTGLTGFELVFGDDTNELIQAQSGQGEIINPLGGDDTVEGASGAGTGDAADLFVASAGKDVLRGGDNPNDWLLLPGLLSRFTFTKVSETAPLVIYDTDGKYGFEVVYDIENFAFLDGFYDLDGLEQAGVVQSGGSSGADLLIGSEADELFVHTSGQDSIDASGEIFSGQPADPADGGTDTWLLEDDPTRGYNITIYLDRDGGFTDNAGTPVTWEGRALLSGTSNADYLNSIEDVIIQDNSGASVFGSDRANFIQGNRSDDYLVGEGGDDTLLGGGGRDLLIGGAGADRLLGEGENDKLIGGPSTGEVDFYDGGTGYDHLIYSNNTVEYDIEPPTGFNIVNGSLPATGNLRIDAAAGTAQHLSPDLMQVIATDSFQNFEVIVGSDQNDTLRGADAGEDTLVIDGGGGDDLLYSDGASRIVGGFGNDTLFSTAERGDFEGGNGVDTLDLRNYDGVRWSLENIFGSGIKLRAVEVQDTEALVNVNGSSAQSVTAPAEVFRGDADGIEVFYLGDGDDNLFDQGTGSYTIFAGDGDDRLIRRAANDGSHTNVLYGEGGNDYLELTDEDGSLYGGAGDDTLRAALYGQPANIEGGEGDDLFFLERVNNYSPVQLPIVQGGAGYDVVSFDLGVAADLYRLDVDLERFAAYTPGPSGSSFTGRINLLLFDIEGLIASDDLGSSFKGTDSGERFIGLSQDDTLIGRGGDDQLYGGGGYDLIEGGDGDDLIHPGTSGSTSSTRDIIDGDDGIDTLTFANARPESVDGSVIADNFGGVRVLLSDGIRVSAGSRGPDGEAHGAFGLKEIYEIENVTGSQSDDILIGNRGANALAGADGDDTLVGRSGDDVLGGGAGDNQLIGGLGDDTFLVSEGNSAVLGNAGFDTLSFAGRPGAVQVDLSAGSFGGALTGTVPVWADTETTEARGFAGQLLTPRDVLEADLAFANDAADLTRILPTTEDYAADPDLPRFDVTQAQADIAVSGRLSGIEEVIGTAGADALTGRGADEHLSGEAGDDTVIGGQGSDTLSGGNGRDLLRGDTGAAESDQPDLVFLNENGYYGPDYLSTTGFAGMPGSALTFEALVQLEDTSSSGVGTNVYTLMSYAVGSIYNAFTVITTDATSTSSERYLRIIINNQVVDTTVPVAAIYDGDLHRVSVAWDGTAGLVTIYLDGVEVWSESGIAAATTALSSGGTLIFGQDQDSLGGSFSSLQDVQGGMGDIRLWSQAITPEIAAAHATGTVPGSLHGAMAGYWQMDAATETVLNTVGPALSITGDVRFEAGSAAGTAQNDLLEGGGGADTLEGQQGDDTLLGGDQNDLLRGGDGHDSVEGGNGRDTVYLGAGNDLFRDNAQDQFGEDTIRGNGGADTILGGGGNDLVEGQDGNDSVTGGEGDDLVTGGAGADTLRGGNGNDTVVGGDGRDQVFLGAGNDLFSDNGQGGISGQDTVTAGIGNDTVIGGGGNDLFYAQDGNDSLTGGLGADSLYGGNGNDTLKGHEGFDVIYGGNGRDRAELGNGNDRWIDNAQSGPFGADLVFGGNGADTLQSGAGDDTLTGGAGADVFVFAAQIDADVIQDYALGLDALQIDAGLWGGALTQARLDALSDGSSGNLVLSFGDGHSLTLQGLADTSGLLSDITLI